MLGWTGWQDYQVADDHELETPFTVLPDPLPAPLEDLLGVLGITAWLAVEIADPQPGRTVVVSTGAGAVGSIAGQLAKERGTRVIGLAGGGRRNAVTSSRSWDSTPASTDATRTGATGSTRPPPTASTRTSKTSAGGYWTMC